MSLLQGSTFINKQYHRLGPHLWVVISDPTLNNNEVVIVNVTTWRDRAIFLNDASCILEAGEHPFIDKKSYVYYGEAKLTSESSIRKALVGGVLTVADDCTSELLGKILLGAAQSPHTPIKIIGVLREQGLIE